MEEADGNNRAGTAMKAKGRVDKDKEELEQMREEVERLDEEQSLVVKKCFIIQLIVSQQRA